MFRARQFRFEIFRRLQVGHDIGFAIEFLQFPDELIDAVFGDVLPKCFPILQTDRFLDTRFFLLYALTFRLRLIGLAESLTPFFIVFRGRLIGHNQWGFCIMC